MNNVYFQPLLAESIGDKEALLRFPFLISHKYDGIRATVQHGKLISRSLKVIPNVNVQERFKDLPEGLDGELISGDPKIKGCMQRTSSIVMSEDKPAGDLRYYVFDKFSEKPFIERLQDAYDSIQEAKNEYVTFVEHIAVANLEDLMEFKVSWIRDGWEGVMLRKPDGRYKQGRSSFSEHLLLRIKPMEDYEGIVVGTTELQHNGNPATLDELGYTTHSSHQANMQGLNSLGALELKGIGKPWDGVEFKCGTGFKQDERKELWGRRDQLIGLIAKVKYQMVGSKDKPRLPVFLGWRDRRDMSE